jgi:TPP-dependent pyruvate/acetoin dehydrogenase alpha subunit
MDAIKFGKTMLLIRKFEEKVEEYFSKGILRGTTHGSIGQELIASVVMDFADIENDYIFATHRGHGYFLAYSQNPFLLASEMMGKMTGPVFGAGGSQHIKYKNFFTNGITGGMASIAVGTAFQLKRQKKSGIAICILGDGGFNEGYVQEAFNLSSIWNVPILFILENNKYAMSTRSSDFTAGTIEERIKSYHILYNFLSTSNVEDFYHGIRQSVEFTRRNNLPCFVEVDTFRFCGHSKSDECAYINIDEKNQYISNDPLYIVLEKISSNDKMKIIADVEQIINEAFLNAERSQELDIVEFVKHRETNRNL